MSAAASVNVRSCLRLVAAVSDGTKCGSQLFLSCHTQKMELLILIAKGKEAESLFEMLLTLLHMYYQNHAKDKQKTKLLSCKCCDFPLQPLCNGFSSVCSVK